MIDGVRWNTHRYVYFIYFGDIEDGLVIRHTCHNTKCCNPDHLTIGSHKDNYHDSIDTHSKNRMKMRLSWIIDGVNYSTLREASTKTKISQSTIIKHVNVFTRVFDIDSYRTNCYNCGLQPKI